MNLTRYAASDLKRFLVAVDTALGEPAQMLVIGGGALVLAFGGTAATSDLDTYESDLDAILEAAEEARRVTGLAIPIRNSGIAQLPQGYEARLTRPFPELEKLDVRVLGDRHDLAASKLLRGNEHDRQQLVELHRLAPLDQVTLVARFEDLMKDLVGDPTEPRWALRHFVEEIWGELAASELDP